MIDVVKVDDVPTLGEASDALRWLEALKATALSSRNDLKGAIPVPGPMSSRGTEGSRGIRNAEPGSTHTATLLLLQIVGVVSFGCHEIIS